MKNTTKNTKTATATSTKKPVAKKTTTKTATSTKKPVAKKATSKKAQSVKIVKRMLNRKNVPARKVIIDELMTKAGLSANGAATYYQNVVSGKWG